MGTPPSYHNVQKLLLKIRVLIGVGERYIDNLPNTSYGEKRTSTPVSENYDGIARLSWHRYLDTSSPDSSTRGARRCSRRCPPYARFRLKSSSASAPNSWPPIVSGFGIALMRAV